MQDVMLLGIGLFVMACVLCAAFGVREVRRAGDRRLPLIGARGPLRGVDLALFVVALVCSIAASVALWKTDLPFLAIVAVYLVGLAAPFMVTTGLHNRRVTQ